MAVARIAASSAARAGEHTSEIQAPYANSYAVFCCNDPAAAAISPLPLHDAPRISRGGELEAVEVRHDPRHGRGDDRRVERRQSGRAHVRNPGTLRKLVCRLLLQ